jgi:hypothetical protein
MTVFADYELSYFFGALLFSAVWLALFMFDRRHRRQILWGSAFSAPFALTGFLFMPEYWTPPSLFDLDARIGIGIEDILWSAAVGGIASAVVEIAFASRLAPLRKRGGNPHRWAPLIIVATGIVLLELFFPDKSIYNMIVAFSLGFVSLLTVRRDLWFHGIRGGVIFAAVYMLLFVWFLSFYPEFVDRYYTHSNLWRTYWLGVPAEEFLFAISGGALWTVMFEYYHGLKFVQA